MADLDPNIILQGMYTTHPVMPEHLDDQIAKAQQVNASEADVNLVNQQAKAAEIANATAAMNLRNAGTYGKAQLMLMNSIRAKGAQGYSPPAGSATTITAGTPGAPAPADANSGPQGATSASLNAGPGVINPDKPPPPAGVSPYAWDYATANGFKIDKANDWYLDADGNPVSHSSGPELTPAGRPNMLSQDVQYQLGDIMQHLGAPPQFIAGIINDGKTKATEFDKQNAEIYKDMATATDARAKAADSQQQVQMRIQGFMANSADSILTSPNPAASLLQDIGTHPGLWTPALSAAGIDPNKFNPADPQQAQMATKVLQGLQQQSPAFLERQKAASEAAGRGNERISGVDANGQPINSIVHIGPDANAPGGVKATTVASMAAPGALNDKASEIQSAFALHQVGLPPGIVGRNGQAAFFANLAKQYPDSTGEELAGRAAQGKLDMLAATKMTTQAAGRVAQVAGTSQAIFSKGGIAEQLTAAANDAGLSVDKFSNLSQDTLAKVYSNPAWSKYKELHGELVAEMGVVLSKANPNVHGAEEAEKMFPLNSASPEIASQLDAAKKVTAAVENGNQDVLAAIKPGARLSDLLAAMDKKKEAAAPKASAPAAPKYNVGDTTTDKSGVSYVKIKAGSDSDKSNWMPK